MMESTAKYAVKPPAPHTVTSIVLGTQEEITKTYAPPADRPKSKDPDDAGSMVELAAKTSKKQTHKAPAGPLAEALSEAGFVFVRTETDGAVTAHGWSHPDGRAALATSMTCVLKRADGSTWSAEGDEATMAQALAKVLIIKPLSKKAAKVAEASRRGAETAAEVLSKPPVTSDPAKALAEFKTAIAKAAEIKVAKKAAAVPGVPAHIVRAVEMLGGATGQRFDLDAMKGESNYGRRMAMMTALLGYERGSGKVKVSETGIGLLTMAFHAAVGASGMTKAAKAADFAAKCKQLTAMARTAKSAATRAEAKAVGLAKAVAKVTLAVPGTVLDGPDVRLSKKAVKAKAAADMADVLAELSTVPMAKPRPGICGLKEIDVRALRILQHKNGTVSLKLERCNSQGALHVWDTGDKLVSYVLTPALAVDVEVEPRDDDATAVFVEQLLASKSERDAAMNSTLVAVKDALGLLVRPFVLAPLAMVIPAPRDNAAEPRVTAACVRLLASPLVGPVIVQLEKTNSQGALCVYNDGSRLVTGVVPPEILESLRTLRDLDVAAAAHELLSPATPSVPATPTAARHLTAVEHCKENISMANKKFEAPTSVKPPAKSTGTKTPAKKAVAKKEPKGERKASTFRLRNDAKAVWSAFTGQKGEIVGALVKLGAVGAKAAGVTTAAICKALPKVAPKNVAFYMSVWQTKTDPAVVEKIAAAE